MEDDLNQYVVHDADSKKGPKRIKLDDDKKGKKPAAAAAYVPPSSLCIHLSKIPMPELQPPKPNSQADKESAFFKSKDGRKGLYMCFVFFFPIPLLITVS